MNLLKKIRDASEQKIKCARQRRLESGTTIIRGPTECHCRGTRGEIIGNICVYAFSVDKISISIQ